MKTFYIFILFFSLNVLAGDFAIKVKSQTTFTATTSSARALLESPTRNYLLIQNLGTDSITVIFGTATYSDVGVTIPAGGNYEPDKAIKDSVWIRANSATQKVILISGE